MRLGDKVEILAVRTGRRYAQRGPQSVLLAANEDHIHNRPKRIQAAKEFETSLRGGVLGTDLEKQLALLKSGEGAHASTV